MSMVRRVLRSLGVDRSMRRRIDEEMTLHLELKTAELIAQGVPPAEAARQAGLLFGNRTVQAEATRDARVVRWIETTGRDLRFAARSLRRRPGLALTAIASLALGIGATTAIFSLLDAVAFKPLGYPDLERLYALVETKDGEESNGNPLRLRDFASQVSAFEAVAGYYGELQAVTAGRAEPERIRVRLGVGDYLGVLGPPLVAGRAFTEPERAGEPVVVLRARTAARWFGTAERGVGANIMLEGVPTTVVGIAADQGEPWTVDAWAPAPRGIQETTRRAAFLTVAAKLKPDATPEQAAAELAVVLRRLGRDFPETDGGRTARLEPLQAAMVAEAKGIGLVVLGIAAAVLLVACLNLASLLLGRAAERRRESAVRASLGAGADSLIRLYLTESALLAGVGGALGVGFAAVAVGAVRAVDLPLELPRLATAAVDDRSLLFALLLTTLSALGFGTLPAFRAARGSLSPSLNRAAPRGRTRDLLVIGQAAVAVVLLVSSATLVDGLVRLRRSPLGFVPQGIVTARVDLSWNTPSAELAGFRIRALEALAAIPGVTSAAIADRLPFEGGAQSSPVIVQGRTLPPDLETRDVAIRAVAGDYFTTTGMRLLEGAGLREPGTAVVNEVFAKQWLGGRSLGSTIMARDSQRFRVIGVVPGFRQQLSDGAVGPQIFIRAEESYWPELVFLLRTDQAPSAIATEIRRRVAEAGSGRVAEQIGSLEAQLSGATRSPRLLVLLFGGFSLLALLLVAIGLFGVLNGYVANRLGEIAVRLALGATPSHMLHRVTARGVRLALVGVGLGLGASLLVGGTLRRFPISLEPNQPTVLLGAAALFLAITAVCCLIPASRAARIDPIAVLRHE